MKRLKVGSGVLGVWIVLLTVTRQFAQGCSVASPLRFRGEFSSPLISHSECENLFSQRHYRTQHFRVGATGRTSVLHFEELEPGGFLNQSSLVGLLGPDCDFLAEKKNVATPWGMAKITSEGFLTTQILFTKVTVQLRDGDKVVCEAQAEYTGFQE